jgi:hypothetical protein
VIRRAPLAVIVFFAAAASARAQEDNRVALGINVSEHVLLTDGAHSSTGIGLNWRLGTGSEGWGWNFGFGWYSSDLDRAIDGRAMALGELKIRPIVGGYGYTRRFGRLTVDGHVMAGYAFNSFSTESQAAALAAASGGPVAVDASNCGILRPEASFWYDINRRFGLSVDLGYVFARPTLTITSSRGTDSHQLRADAIVIQAGIVYSIF